MDAQTLQTLLAMSPEELQRHLRENKHIPEHVLSDLLTTLFEILDGEPNVLYLDSPIIVCGDIHGQMLDLFKLFATASGKNGGDGNQRYLFMGDYVDRGHSSIETFAYLAYLKVNHRDRFFLLRGNHESRETNHMYGLYNDCLAIYGNGGVWETMNCIFDCLPVAAVIDHRIVCVHGGLSPTITYIDQVLTIDRKKDISTTLSDTVPEPSLENQAVVDLTWSDPEEVSKFLPNRRGKGQLFGPNQTAMFLHNNGFDDGFVARSHQIADEGYCWKHNDKLVIVWSAPNYGYTSGNDACVMHVPGQGPQQVDFWKFDKDEDSHIKPEDLGFDLSYFA
jgi:diadenosine tetraphosphatase ApaH/serine/threonine PP2A family protein phosphatase